MKKYISYISIVVAVIAIVIALVGNQSSNEVIREIAVGGTRFPSGLSADGTEPSAGEVRGSTLNITGAVALGGDLNYEESTEAVTADNTLTVAESGKVSYLSGGAATSTLPAVASSDGVVFRFVVGAAVSADIHIASAEGDNIEGSLMVAGAIVDCDAIDRIDIIADGENLGDYVELRSNGTKWFITASNALSSSKMTCSEGI